MKLRFALAIAFIAILCTAGAVSAQDDVTKEITVSGETGLQWVNTGLTVAAGDTVKLDAKGQVDVGGTWGIHGPEGTTKFSEQPPGYYPLESKLRYGLVARITPVPAKKPQPAQTWIYGEKKEVIAARSGTLWLTVNDDAPEGNEGEFIVTVTIIKKKK
ncbi:MAG: hypothetical protein H7070_11435 [Saprospiraceae bacterium]|nr:hypothetical protein [Pyrinomonadaceae bacterium]